MRLFRLALCGAAALSFAACQDTLVEQNTIVGNAGGGIGCLECNATVRRNILAENGLGLDPRVGGYALLCPVFAGDSLFAACNISWNNARDDSICGIDEGGNQVIDPRFCASDPTGTGVRALRPDSPALPPNNACGVLIGAAGEGCAVTDVLPANVNLISVSNNCVAGSVVVCAFGALPAGVAGTSSADPIAGARVAGSVMTAVLVPPSVVGSAAPQGGAFAAPSAVILVDRRPPKTTP